MISTSSRRSSHMHGYRVNSYSREVNNSTGQRSHCDKVRIPGYPVHSGSSIYLLASSQVHCISLYNRTHLLPLLQRPDCLIHILVFDQYKCYDDACQSLSCPFNSKLPLYFQLILITQYFCFNLLSDSLLNLSVFLSLFYFTTMTSFKATQFYSILRSTSIVWRTRDIYTLSSSRYI